MSHSSIFLIFAAVLLPPLPIFLLEGPRSEFIISIVLTILGWIPGMVYALFIVLSGKKYSSKSIKSGLRKKSSEEIAESSNVATIEPLVGINKVDGAELEKSELSGSQRRASQFIGSSDEVPAIEPLSELSPMKVDPPSENIDTKDIEDKPKEAVPEPVDPIVPEVTDEIPPIVEEGHITEVAKEGKKKSYFGILKK